MPPLASLTQVQSTELQPTRVSVVGSTTLSGQAGLLQGYASLVGCLCAVASSAALTYITSMSSTTTFVSSADNTRKLQTTSSSIARQLKSSGTTLASKEFRSHQFRNSGKCPGLQRYLLNTSTRCCCFVTGTSGIIDMMLSSAISNLPCVAYLLPAKKPAG